MIEVPTMEQAIERARRELEPDYERHVRFRAKQIVTYATTEVRAAEREAKLAETHRREAEQMAKDAAKARRKVYGRKIAGKINPRTNYWLLRSGQHAWAFSTRAGVADAFDALSLSGHDAAIDGARSGVHRDRELLAQDPGIAADALTRHVEHLDGIDGSLTMFEELITEAEARRMEEHKRRAEEVATHRRRQREVALYGTTLDED